MNHESNWHFLLVSAMIHLTMPHYLACQSLLQMRTVFMSRLIGRKDGSYCGDDHSCFACLKPFKNVLSIKPIRMVIVYAFDPGGFQSFTNVLCFPVGAGKNNS